MTYANFLRQNNLEDTIETYREYLKKYDRTVPFMNNAMFEQYANAIYSTRFIK